MYASSQAGKKSIEKNTGAIILSYYIDINFSLDAFMIELMVHFQ
jgi:hypothetical protein